MTLYQSKCSLGLQYGNFRGSVSQKGHFHTFFSITVGHASPPTEKRKTQKEKSVGKGHNTLFF